MSAIDGAGAEPTELWRRRLGPRVDPWLSEAFAAGGAVLAGAGLVSLGLYFGSNWGTVLLFVFVAVAYLSEAFVPRPLQAACTTAVAGGIPALAAFVVFPLHTFNGFRAFELAVIFGWLAVYFIGSGTRGRAVLLGLAVFVIWGFVMLEVGHVQDFAGGFRSAGLPFTSGLSSESETLTPTFTTLPDGSLDPDAISDDFGNESFNDSFDEPPPYDDHSLAIGLWSLAFGAVFLAAVRFSDRASKHARATAFLIPSIAALVVGVIALGIKADVLWFAGVLALGLGLAIGATGNGERRFFTWFGGLGATAGILLVVGDISDRVDTDNFDNGSRTFGYAALLFGIVCVAAALPLSLRLKEQLGRVGGAVSSAPGAVTPPAP